VPETRRRILVVDDAKTQLDWLVGVLEREGYDVRTATTGEEAIKAVRLDPPDLVLLDMVLPGLGGLEVLRIVKARPDEQFIPVIITSQKADTESKVKGLRIGADDYVPKPLEETEILARCNAMLRIKSLQDQLRSKERLLEELSITDSLTRLKNRRFFDERLSEEFRRAQRYSDPLSLIMVDLDHFKEINDQFGHPMGDTVLREAGDVIRASTREPDICARYGGEEFAVILPKTHLTGALAVAERIWKELGSKVYRLPGTGKDGPVERRVTASLGVAAYPYVDITNAELLLKYSDAALYQAKDSGRNTICLYQRQSYRYDAAR
jgi:diguanylate cyclase (GGDEF)-like protein